jgi:hypothetical protein
LRVSFIYLNCAFASLFLTADQDVPPSNPCPLTPKFASRVGLNAVFVLSTFHASLLRSNLPLREPADRKTYPAASVASATPPAHAPGVVVLARNALDPAHFADGENGASRFVYASAPARWVLRCLFGGEGLYSSRATMMTAALVGVWRACCSRGR